jgi:hypothetical protein
VFSAGAFLLEEPMAPGHPNKHIREAIKYAEEHGWTFHKSRGHSFGVLRCPQPGGCRESVYSTPRVPEDHADGFGRL